MSSNNPEEVKIAKEGLENLLKSYEQEYLYDIYSVQGLKGLVHVLKSAPENIYREVWTYIKLNKSSLRYYSRIPDDV